MAHRISDEIDPQRDILYVLVSYSSQRQDKRCKLFMAVSIPAGIMLDDDGSRGLRNLMTTMTYVIVLFSIIVEGVTVPPMINSAKRADKATTTDGQMDSDHRPETGGPVQDSQR